MGVYEVTQGEYASVMATNPSVFSKTGAASARVSGQNTNRFPVETVSWFDAIEFCNKLSMKDDLAAYYILTDLQRQSGSIRYAGVSVARGTGYRLPTEAEWEYACRGNTTSPFHFGTTLNGDQANVDGTSPYGTTLKGTFVNRPTTVGSYSKNVYGLYDLHGNVAEWCADIYDPKAYAPRSGTTTDPLVWSRSGGRVLRGGSWYDKPGFARASNRARDTPGDRDYCNGFRVVTVGPETP